jgi:uncharacterized protein (DUF849 family)
MAGNENLMAEKVKCRFFSRPRLRATQEEDSMQLKVIITCAVTGAGDTVGKHPAIPVTPEQIANSALEAASAGATVVHCHVREPSTGKGSRKVEYYAEVMERIRAKNKEVIINLTAAWAVTSRWARARSPWSSAPAPIASALRSA